MTKGDRIRILRESKGMTQEELAKLLNTKRQTISKYEKGIVTNIPSDRIENIAKLLDSTPEYILGWEKVQKKNDTMTDIVLRMRTDSDFLSIVESLHSRNDSEIMELIKTLLSLDDEKIHGVKQMLSAFLK